MLNVQSNEQCRLVKMLTKLSYLKLFRGVLHKSPN